MSTPIPDERWRRLEPLLDQGLLLEGDERSAFLARVGAEDAALGDDLQRMLAECEQPDARLDRSAVERYVSADASEEAPIVLPYTIANRYVLERELGSGGMATVYLSRDLLYEREVAVKVLKPSRWSRERPERFLEEIRVTAKLQHENILPLFDSGRFETRLYYVMPYVDGETLRQRLRRASTLSPKEAVRIGLQVAHALAYAHQQGVIHRDIKPANILLSRGGNHVYVADFGVALALSHVGNRRLTSEGLVVGTPAYMSPEQRAGSDAVDQRSDVFSFACVVTEMLTGSPRLPAAARRSLLWPHLPRSEHVESRAALTAALRRVLARASDDVPNARYASVEAFTTALSDAHNSDARRARSIGVRIAAVIGGLAAVATSISGVREALRRSTIETTPAGSAAERGISSADTTQVVVFPFEYDAELKEHLRENELLREALQRWHGIKVIDPEKVSDKLGSSTSKSLRSEDARRIALTLRAGRYVRGSVSRRRDDLRVHAVLYDSQTNSMLGEQTVLVPNSRLGIEFVFFALADSLLFRDEQRDDGLVVASGTRSAPARQAFARAQIAIAQWDLARADSDLVTATTFDPRFAQGLLWLAQERFWSGASTAEWRVAAEGAASARERLSLRDQLISDALLANANGDPVIACNNWEQVTRIEPRDFGSWYGYALCLRADDAVVRDLTSPSGWRFRSGYHSAAKAFVRAFQILPTIHRAFRGRWSATLRDQLNTELDATRFGRAIAPDTAAFMSHPSWTSDSLLFVPYRTSEFKAGRAGTWPTTLGTAIRHQRELFRDVAVTWASTFPRSAEAMETLALALELLDDPFAIDTLRHAQALSDDPETQVRLATTEVWMLLKRALPLDHSGLDRSRSLADSLLRAHGERAVLAPGLLAGLAALTGRASLAASLLRHPQSTRELRVPGTLSQSAPALLAFAAMGGPLDSLVFYESLVTTAIRGISDDSRREAAQSPWLTHPATMAFPSYRFPSLLVGGMTGDYLAEAQRALVRGDTAFVRRTLARLSRDRRRVKALKLTPDGFYPEAALLVAIGDSAAAEAWLAPALGAAATIESLILADPSRAGPLVRAMALHAELANRSGDVAGAAQWADAVSTLWAHADPFLQPIVDRMRMMSHRASEAR